MYLLVFILFFMQSFLHAAEYINRRDSDLSMEDSDYDTFEITMQTSIENSQYIAFPDADDTSILSFSQHYFIDKFSTLLIKQALNYLEQRINLLSAKSSSNNYSLIHLHDREHCPFSRIQSQEDELDMVRAEIISNLEMRLDIMNDNELIVLWQEAPTGILTMLCTNYPRTEQDTSACCWDNAWHAFSGATCGVAWFSNTYFYACANPFLIACAIPNTLIAAGRIASGIYDRISRSLITSWLADHSVNLREHIRINALKKIEGPSYTKKLKKLFDRLPVGSISLLFAP